MLILLSIILGVVVTVLLIYTMYYYNTCYSDATTVPFNTWLKFYELNPEPWDMYRTGPRIYYCKVALERYGSGPYDVMPVSKEARVNISFSTYWRYWLWRHKRESVEQRQGRYLQDMRFLTYMQEEVDEVRNKAAKQVEKSMKDSQGHIISLLEETRN